MLPSLGFNEIIILGILALVVVGPKDLPLLFRKLGKWTAKLRGMAQEFRTGFDELARQAELDELKREVEALRRTTDINAIARDLSKPLGTLEDYAGISKPPPAVERAPQPSPLVGEGREGGLSEQSASSDAAPLEAPAPQVEGGRDVPEHADVAPIARSAP